MPIYRLKFTSYYSDIWDEPGPNSSVGDTVPLLVSLLRGTVIVEFVVLKNGLISSASNAEPVALNYPADPLRSR